MITEPVTRADIEQTVEATGTIKPYQIVSVGAQVSGRIEVLNAKLGDTVKAGDLIAEIDSRTQRNTLDSAQAALRSARANRQAEQANLVKYQLAFERQQTMLAAEATSRADHAAAKAALDASRAQLAALDAEIVQQQTAVDTARTNLGYTRVTAPIDGTVLAIVARQGQTVNANQTTPTIVMLGSLERMTVYAEISEADVVGTRAGQEVRFTILGRPDKRYSSVLRGVAPAPESVTSEFSTTSSAASTSSSSSATSSAIYYNGLFDVDNPDGELRTYMTAQVSIVLGRAAGVLTMPTAALGARQPDGRYSVLVLGADGRPEQRTVATGLDTGARVEIRSGLTEGERVVTGEAAAGARSPGRMGPPPMM
ncbi:MAG: efflux RND transporter periplasmic adaptor subunit [Burkholderiaceae bacterium]